MRISLGLRVKGISLRHPAFRAARPSVLGFRTHAERTHSPQHAGLARRGPADRGAKCGTDGDVSESCATQARNSGRGKFCDMARWSWLVQAATGGASACCAVLIQGAQAARAVRTLLRARARRSGRPAD